MYENVSFVIKAICFVGITSVIAAVLNFGAYRTKTVHGK